MAAAESPGPFTVGSKAGRKAKKGTKAKVNSFADDLPTFIEEVVPAGPNSPEQTIRYQLGDILGKGAAATVFKAKNVNTGEVVAIKKIFKGGMRAEALKTFLKAVETEFNLMCGLDHPNIVGMKGRVEDARNIYIVLEYVNGGSLATYLSKYGTFSADIAAAQMKQVLQGLVYLHERGIVHRDIKAANLLITKSGVVKLADFGVSAQLENAQKRYSVVGTPYWMAPEVISMTGHSVRSDVWSLGCTLLELLTGHPPYWDLDQMRAVFCIVQDERPPIPPEFTGDLYRFLHRCFVKDPDKRSSASDLLTHPYIVNAKLPSSSTSSGKFDTKELKNNLKALHGLPQTDTPAGTSHGQDSAVVAALADRGKVFVVNAPAHTQSAPPDVPGSGKHPPASPRYADPNQSPRDGPLGPAPGPRIERAVVKDPRASEPDPHAPVPSLQHHDTETSRLLTESSKEKYRPDNGDEGSPCCTIL